jgi:hypothetical protein
VINEGFNFDGMPSTENSVLAHKLNGVRRFEDESADNLDDMPTGSGRLLIAAAGAIGFAITRSYIDSNFLTWGTAIFTLWCLLEIVRCIWTAPPIGINQRLVSKGFNRP